jgi:hypothetical protein
VACRVIIENGGSKFHWDGKDFYRISSQKPANVETLPDPKDQIANLRMQLKPEIEAGFAEGADVRKRAKAAYLAICLDLADGFRSKNADKWTQALAALKEYPRLLDVLFNKSPGPAGDILRAAALTAGLEKP